MTSVPLLKDLLTTLEDALIQPTSLAASLPDAQDLGFERSLSRPLARQLDKEADRILKIISDVLDWSSPATNTRLGSIDGDLVKDGEYRQVTERVETLLEGADDSIEAHLGIGKAKKTVGAVGALSAEELLQRDEKAAAGRKDRLPANLLHDASLARPQLLFPRRLAMSIPSIDAQADEEPLWKPVLRRKPHAASGAAVTPAAWLVREMYAPSDRFTAVTATAPPPYARYAHPYSNELEALVPPAILSAEPERPPRPASDSFDKTPFSWVGDKLALQKMVAEIKAVGADRAKRELAVDLEHHDYRSWSGFTSLMQLSTRSKDYVIDVLDPGIRDEIEVLNEFFADPSWIKVFHGANSDIIWLQRDLGLYVVGLFDTYHATNVLGYTQHSLASLLAMYTDFLPDKRYQLADWRIRPLNKEMLHYARSDTHYLLDIYDHLRLALLEKENSKAHGDNAEKMDTDEISPLLEVYNRSRNTSASVFSIAPYDAETGHHDNGWLALLGRHSQLKNYATALAVPTLPIKTGWGPSERKLEVLKAVHHWRERLAREEDESPRFVLGNDGLWSIAEAAPADGVAVMKVLGGARGGVSELVRKRKDEIASIVKEVLERCGPSLEGDRRNAIVRGGLSASLGGMAAEEPEVRPLPGLWDQQPVASGSHSKLAATTSSFFGAAATNEAAPSIASTAPTTGGRGLVASISSFFGGGKNKGTIAAKQSAVSKSKQPADPRSLREERVAKVHASLVLEGGLASTLRGQAIPEAAAADPNKGPADADMAIDDVAPAEEVAAHSSALTGDHTYVPLSARVPKPVHATLDAASTTPTVPAPSDNDVVIVSTLADKPKKRRRHTAASATSAAGGTAATSNDTSGNSVPSSKKKKTGKSKGTDAVDESAPITPHDYSTTKSILDAEPQAGLGDDVGGKKKKRKDQVGRAAKGFTVDTSAFRREPRVNNAPKKGAISKSFV